ncbi:immunity 49 family protein [Streptomyces sp. NPDC090021]|uniref:immunity 49 family protein n=1 Tax=Streptomyces sp. NPDC090021 TaxID=3365919 RepID=UPI0037FB8559
MTVIVERHPIPTVDEQVTARLAQEFETSIQNLDASPAIVGMALNEALLQVQVHQALNPTGNRFGTWDATVSAMQVGSAAFAAASITEGSLEVRISHERRTISATGPQFYANAGNWLTTLWFVIICRDQPRMNEICRVPLDLWLRRPDVADKLISAIEMSNPEVAHSHPQDLLQGLLYPPINLFHTFVRKNVDGFGPALAEALNLHKSYWTLTEERAEDIDGAVALGPLAMACLAYDGKLPIDVESPFIPKYLVEHGWLGEFPT